MPYKNIIFTKLMCELSSDERFTDKLDDDGKLIYFCLLLMMGVKENKIPDDEKWLKRTLNLHQKEEKIREKLQEIFNVFPKTISVNGFIKFKNYNKMHNPLGKSEGTPKDRLGMEQIQIQIQIIKEYIRVKRFPVYFQDGTKDKDLEQHLFKRNAKTSKELVLLSHSDIKKVVECMEWFSGLAEKKGLDWRLETILKWYPEYLAKGKTADLPESLQKYAKGNK